MLVEALRYPLAGERADEALVGGWALYLLAGVVPLVPLVPLVGYYVRVLGASAAGEGTPPPATELGRLLVQGTVGVVVLVAFAAVPTALTAGTAGGLVQAPQPSGLLDAVVLFAGGTILLLVTLLFAYLAPAALAAYGFTGRPWSAFDRYALKRAGTHAAYFYRFWVGAVVFVAGGSLAGWLWTLHPVARAVAPLPAVYLQLVACRVWGVGFGAAAREYLADDGPPAEGTAVPPDATTE